MITGQGFRPRGRDVGCLRWLLLAVCWTYVALSVVLPLGALLLTSFQRFATVIMSQSIFTLANYRSALQMGALGSALENSLLLGLVVATVAVPLVSILVWIVYRANAPGGRLLESLVMFPQAVPRLVFGLGLLWAWLYIPIPIYRTLWLLGHPYLTVFLPLRLPPLAR